MAEDDENGLRNFVDRLAQDRCTSAQKITQRRGGFAQKAMRFLLGLEATFLRGFGTCADSIAKKLGRLINQLQGVGLQFVLAGTDGTGFFLRCFCCRTTRFHRCLLG